MTNENEENKQNIPKPDNIRTFEITDKQIYSFYGIIFTVNILINMSNGAFSTLMGEIEKKLDIQSNSILGFMSSMFFIGQVIGKLIKILIKRMHNMLVFN